MSQTAKILIADDDETFLLSTADLLEREGYQCDRAQDGTAAENLLREKRYDLIIIDIKMPGNADFELLRILPVIAAGTPIIVVTGYPSLGTAVESVKLPVIAYLVKPMALGELLDWVEIGVQHAWALGATRVAHQRLEDWSRDVERMVESPGSCSTGAARISVKRFLEMTLHNIVLSLMDLKNLTETALAGQGEAAACHLLECPRPTVLIGTIRDAIRTLERTKSAFKSKELGELRRTLQGVLAAAAEP